MENRILQHLHRLGATPDPQWLLTLLTVLEVERYALWEWNEALCHILEKKVFCPSYRTLVSYLQNRVLGVE